MKTQTQVPKATRSPLYHHKTSGGAEYLTDRFILCPNGDKEGVFEGAELVIRIDGDITKDAEVYRNSHASLVAENKRLRDALEMVCPFIHATATGGTVRPIDREMAATAFAQARTALNPEGTQ